MKMFEMPGHDAGTERQVTGWTVAFLLLTVTAGGLLWYGNREAAESRETDELAAELRLSAQQMTTQTLAAVRGSEQAFLQLRLQRDDFDSMLVSLDTGDRKAGLPAVPQVLRPDFEKVESEWQRFDNNIQAILESRESIARARGAAAAVNESMPAIIQDSEALAETVRSYRPGNAVMAYNAARQVTIAQRITHSFSTLVSGQNLLPDVPEQLQKDTARFSLVLDALQNGNVDEGISSISISRARDSLDQVASAFTEIREHVDTITAVAPELLAVSQVAGRLETTGANLFEATTRMSVAFEDRASASHFWTMLGLICGALALLSFMLLLAAMYKSTHKQLDVTRRINEDNERAIMTLLDEMGTLADGDLTVEASVTQQITGAIADSFNYTIDALRSLVHTINDAANKVASTSDLTRDTALKLSQASEQQARKIVSTSDSVADLAYSISKVSKNAGISAQVAEQSLQFAQKGVESVQKTTYGMDIIRETIQDTSKRIKRLGESSQEIGDIVGLITDIADQTNILALNAAIQASSAGEGGRGFAVVADEVQRLAERASSAAKQIETLVTTIQADTKEAISSMEKTTTNVVSGARQAKASGKALEEIEDVSKQLAELIRQISEEAGEQAIVSNVVGEAMGSIQSSTRQTVRATRETATAIGDLADQAIELRRSVEGFKLPGNTPVTESGLEAPFVDEEAITEDLHDDTNFEGFLISK